MNNCRFFQWHVGPLNERSKEVIKQLKIENIENHKMRKSIAYTDVDAEIEELWVEFRRLKKSRNEESERCKQKMVAAYTVALLSWGMLFLLWLLII